MWENKPFDDFTLQRHITNNCELRCKHCYVDFSKIQSTSLKDFTIWLENYNNFLRHYGINGRIYLTWGDTLLHPQIRDIIDLAKQSWLEIALFGNYHLLTKENIVRLSSLNIKFYQLSMEWLEEKHDEIRGSGTFHKVVEAINALEQEWVYTIVNFTLSEMNKNDLVPLIEYLAYNTNLSRFDFVRVVPIWKASRDMIVDGNELKKILYNVLEVEKKLKKENKKLVIGKKDHLWKLLYDENDKLRIDLNNKAFGCWMWYRHLSILENGNILLCRKIPISIGNLFVDNLINLYQENHNLQSILDSSFIKQCESCKLNLVCKWCPAVSFWLNNGFESKDPQCWKE